MSRHPWEAERELDAGWVADRVRRAFPELAVRSCKLLGEGWDNFVFLVDGVWVLRFPRRRLAVGLLEAEVAALRYLQGRLSLPIPRVELVAEAGDGDPWPFMGYRKLEGRPARGLTADDDTRGRWAEAVGRFLADLHRVPPPSGLPRDELERLDMARRLEHARRLLDEATARGHVRRPHRIVERLEAVLGHEPRTDTLVHGDLDDRHLLVDDSLEPRGVIDWGDVHVGDPAVDLAFAWSALPATARPAFLEAYGDVDPTCWRVARARALWTLLADLDHAHHVGDRLRADAAVAGIERALEDG